MLILSILNAGFVNGILLVLIIFPIIAISLSFHEFGHAFAANLYGDDTAKKQGRITLNPLKHLDLKGTIFMLLFGIGYAKPVPIQVHKFTKLKEGYFVVSIAGIVCNIILFFLFGFVGYFLPTELKVLAQIPMAINANLAIFNLFPIFPMDGGRILECLSKNGRTISAWLERNNLVVLGLVIFSAFYILPIVSANIINPLISIILS